MPHKNKNFIQPCIQCYVRAFCIANKTIFLNNNLNNHTHNSIYGSGCSSIAPEMDDNQLRLIHVSRENAGSLPHTNNANAILTLNTHPGNYNFQLGFSGYEEMWMRSFQATAIDTAKEWNKMLHSGNFHQYAIPLTDENVNLKKGGILAPNGDTYLKGNGKWVSEMLNDINTNLLRLNNGINIYAPYYADLGTEPDNKIYFEALLKWICTNYPNKTSCNFMINASPNSTGWSVAHIYNTSDTTNGLPRYASGIYVPLTGGSGEICLYGCNNYNYHYKVNSPSPTFSLSGTTLTITT